ncbi:MAG TPA: hypothetical protein VE999_10170 [Gemmataceae bacterium]|nr:hypothetical protein [Gemmataceae bacterium]
MASFENEREKVTREEEELLSASGAWNRPWLLAALGLALILGGYAATTYVPLTAQQAEAEHRLQELRMLAQQSKVAGEDDGLSDRLNQTAPPWREPPYQMLGRLAIYFGLFLFGLAGVLMYRSPTPLKKDDDSRIVDDPD